MVLIRSSFGKRKGRWIILMTFVAVGIIGIGLYYIGKRKPGAPSSPKGTRLVIQSGHRDKVITMAFSPDRHYLATGSFDRTVRLWDIRSGYLFQVFRGPVDGIRLVGFALQGKALLAGGTQGAVNVWDISTGKLLHGWNVYVSGRKTARSFYYALSQDGKHLASGGTNGDIHIWNIESGTLFKSFKNDILESGLLGHETDITALAFDPSGKHIVSGDKNGVIFIWPLFRKRGLFEPRSRNTQRSTKPIAAIRDHQRPISSIDFHAIGKRFCVFDMGMQLSVYTRDGKLLHQRKMDRSRPPGLAYYISNKVLLTNVHNGFELLDGTTLLPNHHFASGIGIYCVALNSPKNQVAVGSGPHVGLWNLTSDKLLWRSPRSLMPLRAITLLHPDDRVVAVYEKGIAIWDLNQQNRIYWRQFDLGGSVKALINTDKGPVMMIIEEADSKKVLTLQLILSSRENTTEQSWTMPIKKEHDILPLISRRLIYIPPEADGKAVLWDLKQFPPTRHQISLPKDHRLIAGNPDKGLFCIRKINFLFSSDNERYSIVYWQGRAVIVPEPDRTKDIRDPESGLAVVSEFPQWPPRPLTWIDPDGNVVAKGGSPKGSTGLVRFSSQGEKTAWVCKCSEGSYVGHDRFSGSDITGPIDNELLIWDTLSGRCLHRLVDETINRYFLTPIAPSAHTGGTLDMDFSPDGKTIISCGFDGDVKLWDLETGKLIRCFEGAYDALDQIFFANKGKLIISKGADYCIHVWDVKTGDQTTLSVFRDGNWVSNGWQGVFQGQK